MAQFGPAVAFVLKHEGGYYNDPQTGEESNFGISKAFLKLTKYDIQDPKLITENIAKDIYLKYFWTPYKLNEINNQLVASKLMDMIVNMGPKQAIKILQASINSLGGACVIDGIIGPHTIITVNQFLALGNDSESRLLEELRIKCGGFYKSIAVGVNAKNLKGWLNRANDLGEGAVASNDTLRDGSKDKVIKG
jgi:lysozyme family protein